MWERDFIWPRYEPKKLDLKQYTQLQIEEVKKETSDQLTSLIFWINFLNKSKKTFNSKTHEYWRFDMNFLIKWNRTDWSRFNQDLDWDWKKWVDCSSLVYYSFLQMWIKLWDIKDFSTFSLFNWKEFTNFAKQNFDIIPNLKNSFSVWDVIIFNDPKDWSQHVMIFEKYTPDWNIVAFWSQPETWPATMKVRWSILETLNIVWWLRLKPEVIKK